MLGLRPHTFNCQLENVKSQKEYTFNLDKCTHQPGHFEPSLSLSGGGNTLLISGLGKDPKVHCGGGVGGHSVLPPTQTHTPKDADSCCMIEKR